MDTIETRYLNLKISLIDPIDENGVYNPQDAKPIDSVSMGFYNLGLVFFKVLIECITLLLSRNGIIPED